MTLIRAASFAAVLALVATGLAAAHPGNHWFTTASKQAQAIEDNYDVGAARCYPIEPNERRRYNAHSFVNRTGNRVWDHFECIVQSNVTARVCFTIAHSTGQYLADFYLSSYWYKGCGPRDLRRLG
jgi:hypothetical protein